MSEANPSTLAYTRKLGFGAWRFNTSICIDPDLDGRLSGQGVLSQIFVLEWRTMLRDDAK